MEDIIIILEWIKRLAKDLRNESLRKEIERIKEMNQMNEQLFINKELFLRLNKMLAVIRLSANSRFLIQIVRHFLAPFQLLERFFSLSESVKTEQLPEN